MVIVLSIGVPFEFIQKTCQIYAEYLGTIPWNSEIKHYQGCNPVPYHTRDQPLVGFECTSSDLKLTREISKHIQLTIANNRSLPLSQQPNQPFKMHICDVCSGTTIRRDFPVGAKCARPRRLQFNDRNPWHLYCSIGWIQEL